MLSGGATARSALRDAPLGLSLLPASARLAEFEEAAAVSLGVEGRLRRALAPLAQEFEFAILDCPPRADGVLTANALAASSVALLVVETGAFALQGALRGELLEQASVTLEGGAHLAEVASGGGGDAVEELLGSLAPPG